MARERKSYGLPILIRGSGESDVLTGLALGDSDNDSISETQLQALIHAHPACLPIREIEGSFEQVVSICREMPVENGQVDNFLMTAAGDLIIVEAKLWRNPEARRKVIAQTLDYTSRIFDMSYEELEAAVLRARFDLQAERPRSLYELVTNQADALEEALFIDAVNSNLRKGRALVLVVGDGIRSDLSRLTSLLQSHAGARFTFALVELPFFRLPGSTDMIACPRVLAQTTLIERGVVTIAAPGVKVAPSAGPVLKAGAEPQVSSGISEEQFYEAMSVIAPALPEKLRAFITRLEPLGVYPEFQKSLNLKWDVPDERAFNLGYIKRSGHLWTDASNWFGRRELGHTYNRDLAAALGLAIDTDGKTGWKLVTTEGRMPRIDQISMESLYKAIEKFVGVLRSHYQM